MGHSGHRDSVHSCSCLEARSPPRPGRSYGETQRRPKVSSAELNFSRPLHLTSNRSSRCSCMPCRYSSGNSCRSFARRLISREANRANHRGENCKENFGVIFHTYLIFLRSKSCASEKIDDHRPPPNGAIAPPTLQIRRAKRVALPGIKTHSLPTYALLPSQLYSDHSHGPVLAPATLAALPSTRAIETRSLPPLARCYPCSFTFYVADPSAPFPSCADTRPSKQ